MSALDLLLSRQALAAGVGMTTRRNKVLPGTIDDQAIGERTGIGKPKFDTPSTEVVEDRPFVFGLVGGLVGTIASRIGTTLGLNVIRTDLPIKNPSYWVSALSTFSSKWRDTWRVDERTVAPLTRDFLINGATRALFPARVPLYDRSLIPFITNNGTAYQSTVNGSTTRSAVVVGFSSTTRRGVAALTTSGDQLSILSVPSLSYYHKRGTAGLYLKNDGTFMFIGGTPTINTTPDAPTRFFNVWAKIRATLDSPYLAVIDSGFYQSNPTVAMGFLFNVTATPADVPYYKSVGVGSLASGYGGTFHEWPLDDGTYISIGVWPDISKPRGFTFVGWTGTSHYTRTTTLNENTTYSVYPTTGFEMTVNGSVVGSSTFSHFVGAEVWENGPGCQPYDGTYQSGTSSVTTSNVVDIQTLGVVLDVSAVISTTRSGETATILTGRVQPEFGDYHDYPNSYHNADPDLATIRANYQASEATYVSAASDTQIKSTINNPFLTVLTTELVATAIDYIFVDPDEEISLALVSELVFSKTRTYNATTSVTTIVVNNKVLTIKYRLKIRGQQYEFAYGTFTSFTDPTVYTHDIFTGLETTLYPAYHRAYEPTLLFSPPFMSQGNCPYIGYTTKVEEAAGAAHQFYLDMTILPSKYLALPGGDTDLYSGVVRFCPHHLLHLHVKYIQGENPTTHALLNNLTYWQNTLFPSASPARLQFANGVAGAWNTALGSPFTSNPTTEITRI